MSRKSTFFTPSPIVFSIGLSMYLDPALPEKPHFRPWMEQYRTRLTRIQELSHQNPNTYVLCSVIWVFSRLWRQSTLAYTVKSTSICCWMPSHRNACQICMILIDNSMNKIYYIYICVTVVYIFICWYIYNLIYISKYIFLCYKWYGFTLHFFYFLHMRRRKMLFPKKPS